MTQVWGEMRKHVEVLQHTTTQLRAELIHQSNAHWHARKVQERALVGSTTLHRAVTNLKADGKHIQRLLEMETHVDGVDSSGNTALLLACKAGNVDIVQQLLSKGADPNKTDKLGCSALMVAASEGHDEVVRLLLQPEYNVNINHKNLEGETALMWATLNRRQAVVMRLLDSKAPREHAHVKAVKKFDFFFGHTKQSQVGQTETLVYDMYDTMSVPSEGVHGGRCFFDVKNLAGRDIANCLPDVCRSWVHVLVLDDRTPHSKWAVKEVEESMRVGNPIVAVYNKDKFRWIDVGEPYWDKCPGPDSEHMTPAKFRELTKAVFAKGALALDFSAEYQAVSKEKLIKKLEEVILAAKEAAEQRCADPLSSHFRQSTYG
eukprot:GDKI01042426.1.p1 GENE.GDKI01042426.1~~GDKI01042426.1.p1  ORF type:complete len:375 (+),score=56.33 GDKI01042426.1:547-1671(+)